MQLDQALRAYHAEAEFRYLPKEGWALGHLQLVNDQEPLWTKRNGIPYQARVPLFRHIFDQDFFDLSDFFNWARQQPSVLSENQAIIPVTMSQVGLSGSEQDNCPVCKNQSLEKSECPCQADPRCTCCAGTGYYYPICNHCYSDGKINKQFHVEVFDTEGASEMTIFPYKLIRQPLDTVLDPCPWTARTVFRHVDSVWLSRRELFPYLDSVSTHSENSQAWARLLHRILGPTTIDNPAQIELTMIPDLSLMLTEIAQLCEDKGWGFLATRRRDTIREGLHGWTVYILDHTGYNEISSWYSLDLPVFNALTYLRNN